MLAFIIILIIILFLLHRKNSKEDSVVQHQSQLLTPYDGRITKLMHNVMDNDQYLRKRAHLLREVAADLGDRTRIRPKPCSAKKLYQTSPDVTPDAYKSLADEYEIHKDKLYEFLDTMCYEDSDKEIIKVQLEQGDHPQDIMRDLSNASKCAV